MSTNKDLEAIKQFLDLAESNIRQAKSLLFSTELAKKANALKSEIDGKIIEGVFDGEGMVGPEEKKYPVPANYASKSKLVCGDVLKLTILEDGTFVYKQIDPIERVKLIGELGIKDDNQYFVSCVGKQYNILTASVTYFKAKEGDKLTILVPENAPSEWAAVENLFETSK